MKIAWLLDTYPSLSETFIARDIEGLRRQGLEIEIFALQAGTGAHAIPVAGFDLTVRGALEKLSHGSREEFFKAHGARWWGGLADAASFDHIHAGWASHPASLAWGAAQASGLPWSFSGHARDLFVDGGDLAGKLTAANFAAVCTRAGAEFLRQRSPAASSKIFYMPHGVDANAIPFREWSPSTPPRFLAVGRLVEKKGFGVLLDALAILQARDVPFTARIIGDGPLRSALTTRRNRLGLKEHVQLPGALPQPEILEAMRGADCLVVPSIVAQDGDRDGLPNVILEAAACGLPIVATRAGAIEEFVESDTGRLVEVAHPEALSVAMFDALRQESATRQQCQSARRKIEESYDLDRNAVAFAALFRSGGIGLSL